MRRQEKFIAIVKAFGKHSYVDVPPIVVESLGAGEAIPVLVKVRRISPPNRKGKATRTKRRIKKESERLSAIARIGPGGWFRSTLVPSRSGELRLRVDRWMREATGACVRDRVYLVLKPDPAPRVMHIPDALRETLEQIPDARAGWDGHNAKHQRRRRQPASVWMHLFGQLIVVL